jgi:hypothetical protein
MKLMRPLEEFVCDTCGKIIKEPREGWLEWIYDTSTHKAHSFRICHHQAFSPLSGLEGCYRHGRIPGRSDMHLHHILENRMAQLLRFIDVGKHHEPVFSGPHATDLREWSELARRLTIPHYEQARLYWDLAQSGGYFQDANEILIYTEKFLKELIEQYADDVG